MPGVGGPGVYIDWCINITGCIKKKVIELQRAIIRELLAYEQLVFIFGKIRLLAIE
jgi:hypothetical protein